MVSKIRVEELIRKAKDFMWRYMAFSKISHINLRNYLLISFTAILIHTSGKFLSFVNFFFNILDHRHLLGKITIAFIFSSLLLAFKFKGEWIPLKSIYFYFVLLEFLITDWTKVKLFHIAILFFFPAFIAHRKISCRLSPLFLSFRQWWQFISLYKVRNKRLHEQIELRLLGMISCQFK